MKRLSSDQVAASLGSRDTAALSQGVIVTEAGRDAFVLISVAEYTRLTSAGPPSGGPDTIPDDDLDAIEWNR